MQDWGFAQSHPGEQLARVHHFSMCKVEPDRDYTLAVSDFTAENQGTQENLRTTGLRFPNEVGLMRDLLIDWFRKKKTIE